MKYLLLSFLVLLLNSCATFREYRPDIPEKYTQISENSNIYEYYDEFKNVRFYHYKYFFPSSNPISLIKYSPIEVYLVKEPEKKYLRIIFRYRGSEWIFFEKAYLVNSEGDRLIFSFKQYNKTTEVISGVEVREEIDKVLPVNKAKELLSLIGNNKGEIKLRLSGRKYYKEYILTEKQINGLIEIISFES